jgi:hypothetical protein
MVRAGLRALVTGPIQRLITRGQQAGAVRPDVDAADFAIILPMLSSVTDLAAPGASQLARRYLSLVLAGAAPGGYATAGAASDRRGTASGHREPPGASTSAGHGYACPFGVIFPNGQWARGQVLLRRCAQALCLLTFHEGQDAKPGQRSAEGS